MQTVVDLRERVAIVTGAGQGIGAAIARRLGAAGAHVAVTDLVIDAATAVAGEIRSRGGQASAHQMNVTDLGGIQQVVGGIAAQHGRIDILVNNAGWDKVEPFVASQPETWQKVVAINFLGVVMCSRAVLDTMIRQKSGKIVCISSDAGRVGSSGEAVYAGAKAGVIGFAKSLARETARYNLNVNCVCPGPTETELLLQNERVNPELYAAMKKAIPFRSWAKPEDIADAVLFFASDASRFVTGQALSVSGGLVMV